MEPLLSKVAALAPEQQAPAEQLELAGQQAQVAHPGTEGRTTLPTEDPAIIDLLNLFLIICSVVYLNMQFSNLTRLPRART